MKLKSFFLTALALTGFAGNAWADTDKLTAADGWTKITSVPTASEIANNYYVFVDATHDLMLGVGKGVHQDTKWYSLGVYYRTSVEPTAKDFIPLTWTLETQGSGFAMRNLDQPVRLFMTEWNAAWKFDTNDVFNTPSEWTEVRMAFADDVWTIQNGKYPNSGYLGPWDNVIENGAECAANKSGNNIGKFHIYAISRTQFKQNLLDNASESNPVDLTPWYVTNATLDNGVGSEWTSSFAANSSNWWGSHAFSNTGAENYQQVADFHQDITIPNGKYKVAMQGATNKPTENEPYVYGIHNGAKTKVYFTQSTQNTPDNTKWDDMQYTLLQMMSNRSFGQVTTDEITVTTGSLTIGYANEGGMSWDVFDNFKLYCTGIDLSAYQEQLADLASECNTFINSHVVPTACESAIATAVATYNKAYSTAKEYSTAIVALTSVLDTYRNDTELQTAYAAYKTMRTTVQTLANTAVYRYSDPGSAKSSFDGAISSANTAVEDATTAAAINTQTANLRAAALTFVSNVTAEDGNPFNLTFLASTAATDWQTANGLNDASTAPAWSVPKPDPSMADFVESYTEASGGESITGNILYQTLGGMPAGYYTVALYAAASYTPGRGQLTPKCTDGQPNITFGFAGDNSLSLPVVHRTGLTATDQVPVNLAVQLASAGELTYGIQKTAAGSNWHVAQIYAITYSKDPDLTILRDDRDALVSEAEGVLASEDANLLTTAQRAALSTAISTAQTANTFDALTEVTMTTLPNAIQTARQQIQTVKDNRVQMIAALERFENDYNLTDGTDYRRVTMSADAWATLIAKVNDVTTALDDVSLASEYNARTNALIAQMDATDASLRLFKSYKAMVEGTTAFSILDSYGDDDNMDTDATEQTAIAALNTAFVDYALSQNGAIDMAAFLGENLNFNSPQGDALNTENSNSIYDIAGWDVKFADADTWAVMQNQHTEHQGQLYIRKNWGDKATTLQVSKEKMLPEGKYKLTLKWNSGMANMTNLSQYRLGNTANSIGETTSGEQTLEYEFDIVGAAQPFDLTLGMQKQNTGNTPAQLIVDDVVLTYYPNALSLANAADNTEIITSNQGKACNVTLANRTFFKDGYWNTLCLPFNVTNFLGTPLAGATVMELDVTGKYDATGTLNENGDMQTSFDADNNILCLYFQPVTSIEAGKPYIVKWDKPEGYDGHESEYDVTSPVFSNVRMTNVSAMTINSNDDKVDFIGLYSPAKIAHDKSDLYIGSTNQLTWPNTDSDFYVNSCRSYFHIDLNGTTGQTKLRSNVLPLDDYDATGIEATAAKMHDGSWFTLDGRKLDTKPTMRGVYIKDGKKIVIL